MGWCWDRLHRLPLPVQLALLAGAHYLTARFGLAFGRLDGIVAPVWPPSGVALVGLLVFGRRAWPAVAVSALAVDLSGSLPAGTALGMAAGTTLEAVVAVGLLRRAGFRPTLDRLGDIGALVGLAAVVAAAGGALIGAASLAAGGLASGGFGETWRVWWLGDILGMLVVAPALLTLLGPRSPAPGGRAERVGLAAVFAAVGLLAFTADAVPHYLLFPLMAWTAARSGPAGAALATAIATGIGVLRTTDGAGPFAGADPISSLHRLDGFLAVLALSGLALAVSVRERNRAQADLRRSLGELEARVAERTRALAADRERLAEAQRIARLGSWEWDLVAGEATCSDEMLRIYGIPSRRDSRFTLEAYMARVHPDDRASVADAVGRAIREATGLTNDHRILVGRERLVRWIRCFVQVTVDDTGAVVRLTGTNQDITERKQAEERFRELLESAPDAMLIVDSDFRLSLVNRQAEALLGYPRAELIGQPVEMLLPERFRQSHARHGQAYFVDPEMRTMGAGNELFALRRDGTEIPVEITLSPLQTDSGLYVSAAVRDVSRRKETEDQLAHQAMHDSLTHLPNRTLLTDRLTHALARAGRAGTEVAVLFLDLDRFKPLNDTHGHAAGDDVLVAVADRLRGAIRSADTVARIGGDEFVVVCDDAGEAPALAQRIAEVFEEPFAAGGDEVHLTVSLGMATSGPRRRSPEGLLADADAAMYRAKERGRARVECFDETMRSAAAARLESQNALQRAIDHREFRVFYQPIVNLRTGRVDTVEALVRWEHADGGIVGPTEFIPIAEESGLIVPLGTWVLGEAARQHRRWREQHPDLRLSVNLSARQLRAPDLVASVQATLEQADLDPRVLTMELTESVLMEDLDIHHHTLPDLRALGVQLAIDDFGTGYSSLTYLRRFPVDTLKIDQSFVAGLSRGPGEGAVVESVVELAHALGLRVVAEGVEDPHQVDVLRRLGCDHAQGFHFARPQPAEAIGQLLGRTFLPRSRVEPAASGAA